ncbi:Sec-independent protein translocase protein TatB [Hoeflea sp. YIM 152468]|uniref:Sec-independent protein translocase protein TatB n=1 Tax=Hoeflea sp. YIM 152468 TaxID=3031759 RepID=UPI0023D99C85|nr:Sec-independent protein translocase protein TatB [Hoeflea sp. YIM 152468]MDF1609888.1 Sec-independent protein translocase protein TatB [Hoeflea sp. YIM 152468]
MFDIGWPELLVVAIVLIIVVGPKDLPPMLRAFGRTTKKLRAMAGEFRGQFDDALREAELDDVKKTFDEARKLNPMQTIRDAVNPLKETARDLKSDLDTSMKTPSAAKDAPPKTELPDSKMKLGDGPPDFKASEPVVADSKAKPASKPAAASKSAATAKKAPAKAAKPAAKTKAAAKSAPAKSAPRASKPKGEGQA